MQLSFLAASNPQAMSLSFKAEEQGNTSEGVRNEK